MNSEGQVVGETNLGTAPAPPHAFRWTAEAGSKDLNDLVETGSLVLVRGRAISELGTIVGHARRDDKVQAFAILPEPPPADLEVAFSAPDEISLSDPLVYTFADIKPVRLDPC